MPSEFVRSFVFFLIIMLGVSAVCSAAVIVPKRVYGNVGAFYNWNKADGGATTNSSLTTISLNVDSYVWRPWFANFDFGATSSMTNSETATTKSNLDLLSSHLNFSLMSRSRYPFRLSYNTNDNVTDWTSGKITLLSLGPEYKTRYLNARQSYISLAGNRVDAWYTQRTRRFVGVKMIDNTFGSKIKMRGRSYNLYGNGTYQRRTSSVNAQDTINRMGTMTYNYFPSKEFYIKTQVTSWRNDVGKESVQIRGQKYEPNFSSFDNRLTRTTQMNSFMYWRPDYKPYTATGGIRVYRRDTDDTSTELQDTVQQGVNANLAGNYKINRRLRATVSAAAFGLYNSGSNDYVTVTSNQNALINYRSDKIVYREYQYNWFASGGVTNKLGVRNADDNNSGFEPSNLDGYSKDISQNYRAGAGHTLTRTWVTGNRSTLRVSLNQLATETVQTQGKLNSLGISHSSTINWNEQMKKGKFYSQLTVLDTRNLDESNESQLVNFQVSRVVPINRLSQWGSHLSAQSSRRYTSADSGTSFLDGFLTTVNGRLNYQHARMFGIYKLKMRTRLEYSSTANRRGGDRKQADWETRLGYNIGKLSTALIGRKVWSDSGLGTGVIIFQVNRSF